MAKSDLPMGLDYAPVADRIALFYERFPAGRIITHLTMHNEREIVFRASVYRTEHSRAPSATGWASERIGDGDINTVACLENTETSAIGRALANLGFTASGKRPSAEEIAKAARVRGRGEHGPQFVPNEYRGVGRPVRVAETGTAASAALQQRADRTTDALAVLAAARRAGFSSSRAEIISRALTHPDVPDELVRRWSQLLREWVAIRGRKRWPGIGLTSDDGPGSR